jgi:hypothetical protein
VGTSAVFARKREHEKEGATQKQETPVQRLKDLVTSTKPQLNGGDDDLEWYPATTVHVIRAHAFRRRVAVQDN